MQPGQHIAPVTAAALTDAGMLLVLVASGVAIVVFAVFVAREVLSRRAELPRELPPAHELPPLDDPGEQGPRGALEGTPPAERERRPNPGSDRTP